jgi:predicted transcriptional regulator
MHYNFEQHRKYLEGELVKEKANSRDLTEELKISDAKINQIVGALETIDVIERESLKTE